MHVYMLCLLIGVLSSSTQLFNGAFFVIKKGKKKPIQKGHPSVA